MMFDIELGVRFPVAAFFSCGAPKPGAVEARGILGILGQPLLSHPYFHRHNSLQATTQFLSQEEIYRMTPLIISVTVSLEQFE